LQIAFLLFRGQPADTVHKNGRCAVLRIAGAGIVVCEPARLFSRENAQKTQKNVEGERRANVREINRAPFTIPSFLHSVVAFVSFCEETIPTVASTRNELS
jgi:hypothetical protein